MSKLVRLSNAAWLFHLYLYQCPSATSVIMLIFPWSAAIVMRTVRNIVDTGRTIVCTIHQPSVDIFETFDELLLMKQGGKLIYFGPLGSSSCKMAEYFEAVEGVPKIKPGYNPATWILVVTSPAEEIRLGVDFAEIYYRSNLFKQNKELIDHLRQTSDGSSELSFPRKYARSFMSQFIACLWKQCMSYWRNPEYTAVRFFYTVIISSGTLFFQVMRHYILNAKRFP